MIITVKEARKILGKEQSEKLSDEELEKLIDDLDFLAKAALDMAIKDRINSSKDSKDRLFSSKPKSKDLL